MSNLSGALQRYYARDGKRIVFRNGQTLNKFALAMWEQLGCSQIDASVLSRVLKGERLFTAQQLAAFCSLIDVPDAEKEYLLACLRQDYDNRLDVYTGMSHVPTGLALDVVKELTADSFDMFYEGDYGGLDRKFELVRQLAGNIGAGGDDRAREALESVGVQLYLRGRTIANGELASTVIGRIRPIYRQLLEMSRTARSQKLYGYAHVLMCTAYYLAGGYTGATDKRRLHRASIRMGREAIRNLSADDHESMFAMRSVAASAYYTQDADTIQFVRRRLRKVLPLQPQSNHINGLLVGMTLSKGLASTSKSDPFSAQEAVRQYFKTDLANTGVYEVSGIKEEVDTLLLLGSQDKEYIRDRLKQGVRLAQQFQFARQQKYFNGLLGSV